MATPWGLTCLFIGLNILKICNAHPMEQLLSGSEGPNGQVMGVLVAVMVSVCLVFVLLACICCKRRSGFKENENEKKVFRNSPVTASVINETSLTGDDPGHVNPIASAEFTIFTPLSPPHHNNNVFRSQPPVICYTENEAAPELNKAVNPQIDGIDVSEWFADTEYDFPRSRLKYIRELGTGWFGRIVEGEAHGIDSNTLNNPTWTPVAVRILESSASAHEQAQFLHEASIYRSGAHPNMLQLLGRSLEASPFLLIQEFCPKGDLKKFLLENKECKDSEMMVAVPLRYCVQLASAVQFLHEQNLPHLDLAARTCQIASDLSLKLGDYGLAVTQYPNDYYQGTPSIPVRWCAPESVNHTNTTLQPKQVTLEANIWSLAVTFWEICEWGRLPYDWLTDDEVISQVMDKPHTRLPHPTLNTYYIQPLYRLMEYCWLPCPDRPQINQIYSMLIHLFKTYTSSPTTQRGTNEFSMENFDLRWESFKPNTIIKTDNTKTKSASLTNLHGSFENIADGGNDTVIQMDSWLENVASHTGDMQYVRGLSEAIHELDTALASEQTSSSSSFDPTPNSSLGPARSDTVIHMDDSSYLDSLIFPKRSESGSETEDETWRRRIERGAYSEKVKLKSKSVADLMVLTHIDMNTVRDIFQEELKKLQEERRESLLFVPVQNSDQKDQLNANIEDRNVESIELPINQEIIDSLRNFEPNESLVQPNKTELEVSIKTVQSEKKHEDNLLKSSVQESNLIIEPQILIASDSKLDEKLINEPENILESNQNINQDSWDFDTFLQHEPVTNKIDVEPKESLLIPDNGEKDVVINENQNILSNDNITIEPKNITDNVEEKNVKEKLSENLEKTLEHIEPVNIKCELSLIQDFINNEKSGEHIINKIPTLQNTKVLNEFDNEIYRSQEIDIRHTETEKLKPEIMPNIEKSKILHEDKETESTTETSEIVQDILISSVDLNRIELEENKEKAINKNLTSFADPIEIIEEIPIPIKNLKDVDESKLQIEEKKEIEMNENLTSCAESIIIIEKNPMPIENLKDAEESKVGIKDKIVVEINENLITREEPINIIQEIPISSENLKDVKESEVEIEEKKEHLKDVEESKDKIEDKKDVGINENLMSCAEPTIIIQEIPVPIENLEDIKVKSFKIEEKQEPKLRIEPTELIQEIPIPSENLLVTEENNVIEENKVLAVNKNLETCSEPIEIVQKIPISIENLEVTKENIIAKEISADIHKEINVKREIASQIVDDTIETALNTIAENMAKEEKIEFQIQNEPLNILPDVSVSELSNALVCDIKKETQNFLLNELSSTIFEQNKTLENKEILSDDNIFENIDSSVKDIYDEDLVQNDESNLLNIPPPPEFVLELLKEQVEDKNMEIEKNIPLADINSLVQFDDTPIKEKSDVIEQENIELVDHGNLQKLVEVKQDAELITEKILEVGVNKTDLLDTESGKIDVTEQETVMPDIIETIKEQDTKLQEHLVISSESKLPDPVIAVKSNEFSEIQNFINNERNNNQEDLPATATKVEIENKPQKDTEENSNVPPVSTDLTSELLDTSNVQHINQVFNVFSVTVDHKPPLECFTSPVKNYYARPFDQNEIITDINSLLESEHKYESKNSVCTSSLQNDFLPFVNGINGDLSNKIIDILKNEKDDNCENINEFHLKNSKCEESLRHERPKKLSELVLDSLKTNSISEDSGFASVQCEEKVMNGTKDSSSEDLLKISVDSLEEILSNSEENLHDSDIIDDFDKTVYEQPKKLSEIAFENLKHYSASPDELITSFVDDEIEEMKHEPKKLAELVQDTLNKTYVQNEEEIQNLPDIILHNLQNKTFIKDQNETVLINVINDSPIKSLNSLSDKFEENSESAIEEMCTESDKVILSSPQKSEIILDSLPCNSPVTSESTDNVSDKTVIEIKVSDNYEDIEKDVLESPNFLPTSTPFKSNLIPKKTDINNDSFFSFVSEGDEPSDCQTRVILGPCEEYGLGLYSGLKTTFGKFSDDDRPEEEVLQFSSNFMPYAEADTTHNSVDYSLETWDKFLGKSLQDQDNCESSVFANFSPKHDNPDVFNVKNNEPETKIDDLNRTVILTNNKNETFTLKHEVSEPNTDTKEEESSQVESTQNSWEPGEGWFLHPQTGADDLTGQIDTSSSENIDNSYVGFALDEECVNALRSELAAKLPHAQGISHEEPQEPEDWDAEERNEIIVKYNVYAIPLSPIPEESCCDDVYCDQIQHRDGSDSESDWSEPGLGQTSQLEEDILVVDTETHTALILESPSLREPQHRHTPSQDSCCSNDTLFNLEDLNYGHSPQHQAVLSTGQAEPDSDPILEIEITENVTPKQSPIKIPKIEEELNSDSTEMNLTYTKPDINIDETENLKIVLPDSQTETESKSDEQSKNLNKLELNLDPNAFGVAPLPSPEDIPWRQLPASLLTYNEVVQNDKYEIQDSEDGPVDVIENVIDQEDLNLPQENANDDLSDSVRDCTLDTDLYSNLTDIRFSGPCDTQLMSTSFSESADYNEERDWDSGSDTRSSSSGEFIWKEGEHEESLRALHAASHDVGVTDDLNPMDAIEEENSNSSEDSDDCEDIEETEFVPSAWDAQATPTKSALRSPENSNKRKNQQKGVWFKKQKYHCVYEYPREPESPVAPDLWRPLTDLSSFADWELDPDSCVPQPFDDTDGSYDVLDKFVTRSTYPLTSGNAKQRDLYQLNPFPDFPTGLSASDEDFFISSSARPFQTIVQSSQFFPGQPNKSKFLWQDYQSSSQQSSRDLSEGITPDSGIDDVTPASVPEPSLLDILPSINHKVPPLKCLAAIAANKSPPTEQKNVDSSLGGLRHTRNRLKLDLPPSPNSFSSTRTFSIDVSSNDPVINREIPTFTTFGKSRFSVQHVATPTDESSDPLQPGFPKIKNVSFEALPHKPMKLTEKVYIMDKSEEEGKHKPVEMVQGEASLLDSADEDSGIESSANATLERHQQQVLQ